MIKWILLMIGGLFSLNTLSPAQDVAAPDMPNVDLETVEGQQFIRHREAMSKVILLLLVETVIDSCEKGEAIEMNDLESMKLFLSSFPSDDLLAACPEEARKLYQRMKTITEELVKQGMSWRDNKDMLGIQQKMKELGVVYGVDQVVASFVGRMMRECFGLDNNSDRVASFKQLRERLKTEKLIIPDRVHASGDHGAEAEEGTWFAEAGE